VFEDQIRRDLSLKKFDWDHQVLQEKKNCYVTEI
jgi:hypothetical protein